MRLIMVVTNDEYELPVAVGETYPELARMLGINSQAIHKGLKRGSAIYKKKWKVVEVIY